ncbi:C4-dicarboxylate-binding periplasmic protein [Salinisphaera sp. C84B14]
MKLELHPADSLMGATEIFPAVSRGIIPMGYTSTGYIMDYVPTAGLAFTVPGVFRSTDEAVHFWMEDGFEELLKEEAAEHNVMYFTEKLYPTSLILKKPVDSLAEFSQLKIRSAGLLQTFLSEVGPATTYIPGPEIYQALSTGVVDGAHWGAMQEANSLSLYETAKYQMTPPLGIGNPEAWIINKDAFEALPDDVQKILVDTIEERFYSRTKEYAQQEEAIKAKLQETENVQVVELPQDVQDKMKQASATLRSQEAKRSENTAEAVRLLERFIEERDER